MRTGILTGSFDPFTRGHENLVRRALNIFDQVVILISRNGEKQEFLPVEVRMDAIWACFPQKNVQVVLLEGLLAEFVQQFENPVLVRGARKQHVTALIKGCFSALCLSGAKVCAKWYGGHGKDLVSTHEEFSSV